MEPTEFNYELLLAGQGLNPYRTGLEEISTQVSREAAYKGTNYILEQACYKK